VKSIIVGITGNIGSGKSTVAAFFEESGNPVIRSDDVARNVMENDLAIRTAIIRDFGFVAFSGDKIDRKKLATIVFNNPEKLRLLNSIVHPKTIETVFSMCAKHVSQGDRIIFVESALIYSSRIEERFDFVISVLAPAHLVFNRIQLQRGLSVEEIGDRLSAQQQSESQLNNADFIIRNEGTLDELRRNTQFIYSLIKAYLT
jgi:dephospho-CoA kinase